VFIRVHRWLPLLFFATTASAQPVLAPGWAPLNYPAPAPGSYQLPPLGDAADGAVLDTHGEKHRLHDFMADKAVVLAFVYRSCPDVNGCPLANYVLTGIEKRVRDDTELRERVRLISMSFDPRRDTPEMMRQQAEALAPAGADWQFLTTASDTELAPILRAYGQTARQDGDGTIAHLLRVYLIDRGKHIRNIYSSSLLHADTVTSDLLTLVREPDRRSGLGPASQAKAPNAASVLSPQSSVPKSSLGLPPLPVPADNPLSPKKVALGRKLFFDRRLSHNGTLSCAMCHVPAQGFANNTMATAVGIEGRSVRRNAPTIYNTAYAELLFHDGRESRLEQQVWGPLLLANEMGNPSVGFVLDRVHVLPDYRGLFEAAFDGRGATMETLGMALASYERSLVAANSRFDRWYFGKESGALSPEAERGFGLFTGKAGCAQCHSIGAEHALFTDQKLHNTGVGFRQTMNRPLPSQVRVAPGVEVKVAPDVVAEASETPASDLGRYEISEDPADRWKYKTPTLRNVGLTAPYMHDGSIATLRGVVEFYDGGGVPNDLLDAKVRPLGLSDEEKADLVAFLESLTGGNVAALVADADAAPIGDPQ